MMRKLGLISVASVVVLAAGAVHARDLDVVVVEVEKSIELEKSIDLQKTVDISKSTSLDESVSTTVSDSYNASESISGAIFANPVSKGELAAHVTSNATGVKALGALGPDATMTSGASIEGGAFQSFRGITTPNVNGGANAVQQSNVSISVVSTNVF